MFNNKYLSFTLIVLITFSASAIGGVVTSVYKEPWYSQIIQPHISPPSWVFGPVWTTLYFLMTIAIWHDWHKNTKNINLIYYYLIHLLCNTTWSIVFCVFHSIILALIYLIILILLIIFLIFITNYIISSEKRKW